MVNLNDKFIQKAKEKYSHQSENQLVLSDWLYKWLELFKAPAVSDGTQKMYKHLIRTICTCKLAYIPIDKISEIDIQEMFNTLSKREANTPCGRPYSKSIYHKLYNTLHQSLKKAMSLKYISSNPCTDIVLPKASTRKVYPLTHQEQEKIEFACQNQKHGQAILFLLLTGLRAEEFCNLKWTDLNCFKNEIYITKSKTPAGIRTVPLTNSAKAIITSKNKNGEYIFMNGKRKMSYWVLRNTCIKLRETCKINDFTAHVCRHTFVTRLCEKNVSAQAIAQIIGHSDYSYVLSIYSWLENQHLKKAIHVLDSHSSAIEYSHEIYQNIINAACYEKKPIENYVIEHAQKNRA